MPQTLTIVKAEALPTSGAPLTIVSSGTTAPAEPPVSQRPLLTGLTDAGALQQLGGDQAAMQALNRAKNVMGDVGILSGAAALGNVAAGTPLTGSLVGAGAKALGKVATTGGLYYAAKAAGVPPGVLDALLVAGGAALARGGGDEADEAPVPSNGRLVLNKAPVTFNQQMADMLQELRSQPSQASRVELPPQAQLPPGYTPRTSAPAPVIRPIAAPAAAAPPPAAVTSAAVPASMFLKPADLQPTLQTIPPSDLPTSWHAFLDTSARESADPVERAQAARLHQDVSQMDAAYKARTADTAASVRAMPPSFLQGLVALLQGGGQ